LCNIFLFLGFLGASILVSISVSINSYYDKKMDFMLENMLRWLPPIADDLISLGISVEVD
jgi:hypothetical protein